VSVLPVSACLLSFPFSTIPLSLLKPVSRDALLARVAAELALMQAS